MAKGTPNRKEATNFRLDPLTKYTAEIAARVQRKNLTGFLEWSMNESFKVLTFEDGATIESKMYELWDIDEADRFLKLAYSYYNLLNHEEQRIFKTINENFKFFKKDVNTFVPSDEQQRANFNANIPSLDYLDFQKVREHWEDLNQYAYGNKDLDFLKEEN